MSIHLEFEIVGCKECGAKFIPLKKDFKCPKCDRLIPLPSDWDVSFINKLIETMQYHKRSFGSFTPPSWSNNSFTEATQFNIYRIFDTLEHDNPENPKEHIGVLVSRFKYEKGEEYLQKYLTDVALMVHDTYKEYEEPPKKIRVIPEIKIINKIKSPS